MSKKSSMITRNDLARYFGILLFLLGSIKVPWLVWYSAEIFELKISTNGFQVAGLIIVIGLPVIFRWFDKKKKKNTPAA